MQIFIPISHLQSGKRPRLNNPSVVLQPGVYYSSVIPDLAAVHLSCFSSNSPLHSPYICFHLGWGMASMCTPACASYRALFWRRIQVYGDLLPRSVPAVWGVRELNVWIGSFHQTKKKSRREECLMTEEQRVEASDLGSEEPCSFTTDCVCSYMLLEHLCTCGMPAKTSLPCFETRITTGEGFMEICKPIRI